MNIISALLAIVVLISGLSPKIPGEEGTSFVGFRYDNTGVFPADVKPPTDFDGPSGKNLKWKVPLPNFGNASPIVVGQGKDAKVLVLCDQGWPLGAGNTPVLICFSAEHGKELWRQAIDPLDALPASEADPLRKARHAFWTHQHQVGRLYYRFMNEAQTDAEREAIKAEALIHVPQNGNKKTVKSRFVHGKKSKGRLSWTAALDHPDCALLRKNKKYGNIIGASGWNWTGMGQAMATPVSDGEAVYVLTGLRTVTKLDLNGKVLWHVFMKDAPQHRSYECWLANGIYLLDAGTRRLMVFECFAHIWAYDSATGALAWKVPTFAEGHYCGTPQLLRLPDGSGKEELVVITRTGHSVRVRDGKPLSGHLFNVDYAGPYSDGRDRVWIRQKGGDGGKFKPQPGTPFNTKGAWGLRMRLEGDKLAYDTFLSADADRRVPGWMSFPVRDGLTVGAKLNIFDTASGEIVAESPRGFNTYHGSVLAGGHYYGIPQMAKPHQMPSNVKRLPRSWHPEVDARFVVNVAKDNGSSISFVGQRTVEIIEAKPKDPAKHDQRISVCGGRATLAEWYNWHGAYTAPFAWKNRLYVRSFDYLYCFEH